MMETLHGLYYGFSLAVMPQYLFYAFIGCIIGTFIGVLPGLGPATTIAVLLPITYQTGSPLAGAWAGWCSTWPAAKRAVVRWAGARTATRI